MPATIVKGTDFTNSTTVTVGAVHALVESAAISGIDRANMASGYFVSTLSAAPPTAPLASEPWQDLVSNFPSTYVGAAWVPGQSLGEAYTLSSDSVAVAAGDLLFPSNLCVAGTLTLASWSARASSQPVDQMVAVATAAVSPGGSGVCVTSGVARVNCGSNSISAGRAVDVGASDGITEQASGAAGTGYGTGVFGTALEASSGSKVWINLRR